MPVRVLETSITRRQWQLVVVANNMQQVTVSLRPNGKLFLLPSLPSSQKFHILFCRA